jgi:hypothetical protein
MENVSKPRTQHCSHGLDSHFGLENSLSVVGGLGGIEDATCQVRRKTRAWEVRSLVPRSQHRNLQREFYLLFCTGTMLLSHIPSPVVENMPQSCHYTFYLNIMNTSIKMI